MATPATELTRGFMYAGATRVVASLWRVDDTATAELMKFFYRRMLRDGMRPAAALREAQVEMWKRAPGRSPFYWAGFVLLGSSAILRIHVELSAPRSIIASHLRINLTIISTANSYKHHAPPELRSEKLIS